MGRFAVKTMKQFIFSLSLLMAVCFNAQAQHPVKYVEEMKRYVPRDIQPLQIEMYYDYEEALAAAKAQKKPLMVYFTGVTCINCRKMEKLVWTQSGVTSRMKNDFVVAALYADATYIPLPSGQQYYSKVINRKVENFAHKMWVLQDSVFHSNSQPTYYFVDGTGALIVPEPAQYDPDPVAFATLLDKVKDLYNKEHR